MPNADWLACGSESRRKRNSECSMKWQPMLRRGFPPPPEGLLLPKEPLVLFPERKALKVAGVFYRRRTEQKGKP